MSTGNEEERVCYSSEATGASQNPKLTTLNSEPQNIILMNYHILFALSCLSRLPKQEYKLLEYRGYMFYFFFLYPPRFSVFPCEPLKPETGQNKDKNMKVYTIWQNTVFMESQQ